MTNSQYRINKNRPCAGDNLDTDMWDEETEFKRRWYLKGVAKAETGHCTGPRFIDVESVQTTTKFHDPENTKHNIRDAKRIKTLCAIPAGGRVKELQEALFLAQVEENSEYASWVIGELQKCHAL